MAICYSRLSNCYKYTLDSQTPNARTLFSGGYKESAVMGGGGKEAWTDIFLPPGHEDYNNFWTKGSGKGCEMMYPGINTELREYYLSSYTQSRARIGYGVNYPSDSCWKDQNFEDADGAIGLGLTMGEAPKELNAGFGGGTVSERLEAPKVYQAWLFAIN